MPYLKQAEKEVRYAASRIERGYKIHSGKNLRNSGVVIRFIARFLFLCLFVYVVMPYLFKNFAYPIYIGRFMNKGIKIEKIKPASEKIVIKPLFDGKKEEFDILSFASPTLDYLNNGSLFGVNFVAETNGESPVFTHIVPSSHMTELEGRIRAVSKNYPELSSRVFVYDYKSGKTAEVNADIPTPLASTVKIPVLFEMFRQIESKNRDLTIDKEITFYDIYRSSGSGDLQYSPKNGKYTIDRIANLMITKSDNSATNLILDEIGGIENLNRAYRMWGVKSGRILNWLPDLGGGNKMSMKEMGDILYNLDNPNFLSGSSREKIREYMGSLSTQHLLKAGIPADAGIIHKTGDIGKSLVDCGIVTLKNGNKYIITVAVERPHNNYKAKILIEEISKVVSDYIAKI